MPGRDPSEKYDENVQIGGGDRILLRDHEQLIVVVVSPAPGLLCREKERGAIILRSDDPILTFYLNIHFGTIVPSRVSHERRGVELIQDTWLLSRCMTFGEWRSILMFLIFRSIALNQNKKKI